MSAARLISLAAAAVWLGGLVVLGAVVAPTVFRNVPLPTSANAMILVFRRFDRIALACAAVAVLAEIVRGYARGPRFGALDVARVATLGLATVLAAVNAFGASPEIARLHALGAVRGVGELGLRLAGAHALAETSAKVEALVLLAYLFFAASVPNPATPRRVDE